MGSATEHMASAAESNQASIRSGSRNIFSPLSRTKITYPQMGGADQFFFPS